MNPFRLTKHTRLKELNADLIEGIHVQSGAQFMHIANDDPENLFCLSFQTLPETSNGVAHILEHTVLCGSEKFPIKDPFFAMTRRSLNTFMNALTGPDFTCYPAATQVEKDFYNLLDVYLDAVFHPKLNRLDFLQEGVRLEFKDPTDYQSGLTFKGVVFNEMKGALASGSARLTEKMNRELFPDITYGNNPGGDPHEIPHLTYEELKAFHAKYYHPSQCLFFFYGNMPLQKHLDFIHEKILKDTYKKPDFTHIPAQPRFKAPKVIEAFYPLAHEETLAEKTFVSIGWVTTSIKETLDTLALTTIILLLMDNDASVLKRALMDTKLCKQALAYIDVEMTEVPIILSIHGSEKNAREKLEKTVFDTLEQVVKEGFPKERIESVLHQMEFARSEITGDSHPYGLALFMRSALVKQHGVDPTEGLLIHQVFDQLRQKIEYEPHYLSQLIQKYLIDNRHRVTIVMIPSHELEDQEIDAEKELLKSIETSLSAEDKMNLVDEAKALVDYQHYQEELNVNILPKVHLQDVPKTGKRFKLETQQTGLLTVHSHSCYTNQIVYANLVLPLPELTINELPYLRLMCHVMPQLGAGKRNFVKTLEDEQAKTGGLWTALAYNQQVENADIFYPAMYLKGKALYRNKECFFSLLKDIATFIDFGDEARLSELIHKHFNSLLSSLQKSALNYALNLSAASLSESNQIAYQWFGLGYYEFVKKIQNNIPALIGELKRIYTMVVKTSQPSLVITADETFLQEGLKQGFWGLSEFSSNNRPLKPYKLDSHLDLPKKAQGRTIVSPVAFNSMTFKSVPYNHPDSPSLTLAAHIFDNLTLHLKVREQGGAYGSGASANPTGALFSFYSSRDPHIASTFEAFQMAINQVTSGQFEESDLEEAKLEMIQSLDSPVAPGSRGELAYEWLQEGKTDAIRQQFRERLLAASRQDVIRATQEHIAQNYPSGIPVVFSGRNLFEKENQLITWPLEIKPL